MTETKPDIKGMTPQEIAAKEKELDTEFTIKRQVKIIEGIIDELSRKNSDLKEQLSEAVDDDYIDQSWKDKYSILAELSEKISPNYAREIAPYFDIPIGDTNMNDQVA